MKLVIDLQACQTDSRDRGIGRYALSLAQSIAKQAPSIGSVTCMLDLACPRTLRELRDRLRSPDAGVETAIYGYPVDTNGTDMVPCLAHAAGVLKSSAVLATRADAVLVSSFFEVGGPFTTRYDWEALEGIKKVVVAYDLIPVIFPERYLPPGHFVSDWYRGKLEEFRKFDLFLAISESTKRDLVEHLGIEERRIRVIGAGLDRRFLTADPSEENYVRLAARIGLRKPFVLMVGNADWRKNCMGALRAFAALPSDVRSAHQLVFTRVGQDVLDALSGEFTHLRGDVIIAGSVAEEELEALYKHCKLFFFPSLYEGFGLPILEAMAFGAPVLCSDRGALIEVVRDSAALFDPADESAVGSALLSALTDANLLAALRSGARAHAESFGWDKVAASAIEAILDAPMINRSSRQVAWPSDAQVQALAECIVTHPRSDTAINLGLEAAASGGIRRILVDITEIVRLDARSGVQRVVRNYYAELTRLASGGDFIVEPICWTETGLVHPRGYARSRLNVDVQGPDEDVRILPGDIAFMVDSSWWSPERFDEFHTGLKAVGGEVVWVVYDLVPLNTPEYCDPVMPPVFRGWLEHVARTACGVICISEATRRDLESYFNSALGPADRRPWTRAVHLGSDIESKACADLTPAGRSVMDALAGQRFAMALGTVEPRKDYATVLSAFETMWAEGSQMRLVIVGKVGWNTQALIERIEQHVENGRRLFWLAGASDADIDGLLGSAHALVQASRAEGFGLPVVEAGAKGVPLILSDLSVFREIAGSEATYFPAGDAESLARILMAADKAGVWLKPSGIRTMTWAQSSARIAGALLGSSASDLEQSPHRPRDEPHVRHV